MAERVFVGALFLALGIVAFQEVKRGNLPPRSSPFVGVALVFTVLGILSVPAPALAAAFAVVADLYVFFAYGAQQPATAAALTGQIPQLTGASQVGAGG